MSRNQINFSKMSNETKAQLVQFKESALALAQEDLRFKAVMKPLKAELENILANRQNDLDNGMSIEEVAQKFPRLEVDNAIRKAETEHKAIVEPLNKAMRDTYAFVPTDMHDAYKKYHEEDKRGDYLKAIEEFLENLGIEGCKQGQISKLSQSMANKFGTRYAQSKKIVENGTLTTTMSKAQFNKLFMAVFCDMYVK